MKACRIKTSIITAAIITMIWANTSCLNNERSVDNISDSFASEFNQMDCDSSETIIKVELNNGNWYYFPEEEYTSQRFKELMWKKYSVISVYLYANGPFDSCFAKNMNKLTLSRIGSAAIQKTRAEADSLDRIIPQYLNLDSSYNFSVIAPTYPGGGDFLLDELVIVDDSIYCNSEIWIEGIIDTNGLVVEIEIIRNGNAKNNLKLLKKIANYLLPFTPAYIFDRKVASNPILIKYKKVRLKYRFICQVVKSNTYKPKTAFYYLQKNMKTESLFRAD